MKNLKLFENFNEAKAKYADNEFLGDRSKPYVDKFVKELSFGDKLNKHDFGFLHGVFSHSAREVGKELRDKFVVLGTDRGSSTDYYVGFDDVVYTVQTERGSYMQVSASRSKDDWNKDKPYGKYIAWT